MTAGFGEAPIIRNDGFAVDPTEDKTGGQLEAVINKIINSQGLEKQAINPRKKILPFTGITQPPYIKANIAEIEHRSPFDGMVIGAYYMDPYDGNTALYYAAWQNRRVQWESLEKPLRDLQTTKFSRFTDNLVRLNGATPGTVSWFDSQGMKTVESNWGLVARFAKESGCCKGICLDLETTGNVPEVFKWVDSDRYTTKTFAQHQEKARKYGALLMNALQKYFPGLEVHTTFGYWEASRDYNEDLSTKRYGLYPAFLDGMYDACSGQSVIIDGFELAYGWNTNEADWNYGKGFQDRPPHCDSLEQYEKYHRSGYAIWVDYQSDGAHPWDNSDVSTNYNTPAKFKTALLNAAERADYIYVYNQKPVFWKESLPAHPLINLQYIDVMEEVREELDIEEQYTPLIVPNLIEYWDVDDLSSLSDTNAVSTWTGQKNAIAATNTGGNRPTYDVNGLSTGVPAVKFASASSQYLIANALASYFSGATDDAFTFFVVFRQASNAPAAWSYFLSMGHSTGDALRSVVITSTPRFVSQKVNDLNSSATLSSVAIANSPNMSTAPHILIVRCSATAAEMWLDGNIFDAKQAFTKTGTATVTLARIGARILAGTTDTYDNGWISDIGIYDRFLDNEDMRRLTKHLARKRSITTAMTVSASPVQGTATLVAGTVTVSTGDIFTGDNVLLSRMVSGGTPGNLSVGTITDRTSFVIDSTSNTDTSTVFWQIVKSQG